MGYRLEYGSTVVKIPLCEAKSTQKSSAPVRWIAAGCILLALTLLGKAGCLDFLIPGDKEITKQAFSSMVDDVGNGEDIKTAITAFCMEILSGAEIPE